MPFELGRQFKSGEFDVENPSMPRACRASGGVKEERTHQEDIAGLRHTKVFRDLSSQCLDSF
jgi:hypothetical protein